MIKLNANTVLFLSDEHQLKANDFVQYCVVPLSSVSFFSRRKLAIPKGPPPFSLLIEVFRFDEMIQNIVMTNPDLKLMICAGIEPEQQAAVSFLVACHLIMQGSLGFEEGILVLHPLHEPISRYIGNFTFTNSLRALCCAKCMRWIDFKKDEEKHAISSARAMDMDEYIHYARYGPFHFEISYFCYTRSKDHSQKAGLINQVAELVM